MYAFEMFLDVPTNPSTPAGAEHQHAHCTHDTREAEGDPRTAAPQHLPPDDTIVVTRYHRTHSHGSVSHSRVEYMFPHD